MPARSRTQQAANPSPADPIATLRERTLALQREWRELPQRRNAVLLGGKDQEIVRLLARERQLPLEWLSILQQRAALCRASLEAEQQQLLREREELRQQLMPLYQELLDNFNRFNELQARYACLCPDERELEFLLLVRRPYNFVQIGENPIRSVRNQLNALTDCELQLNRLHEGVVEGEEEVLRRVHAMLDGEHCLQLRVLESIEEKLNATSKG